MGNVNYKKLFAIKKQLEEQVRRACPKIQNVSGIYFYTRVDNEEGKKYAYVGKAKHLIDRSVSHLQGYKQAIDLSLRKRGFYSDSNTTGWHLNVLYLPERLLNEKESYYIDQYRNAGYEMYNIESGGTTGKTMINERKPAKGYRDGLLQGEKRLKKALNELIRKYLLVTTKVDNKLAKKALDKFNALLSENEE